MRPLCCLLLASILAAQAPGPGPEGLPDHWSALGADPVAGIQLTPPGCWDGLLLGATPGTAKRRSGSEATVEVWDLLPPGSPRREAFSLYLGGLRERLSRRSGNRSRASARSRSRWVMPRLTWVMSTATTHR